MLDELRERILKHEDEMATLGHTMNEKLHTELKSAFDQGGYQDSGSYMKNLQEKLKSADEHITLLQSTLTDTETRWKAKVESLKKETGLKDLQIETLQKAVQRSSAKATASQAAALEVDFLDKQSFLRYLDSNETNIKPVSRALQDRPSDVGFKGSQTYLKYLPQNLPKTAGGRPMSFGE